MLETHSIQTHSLTHFAANGAKRALFEPHSPRENHLLAMLPSDVYERLLPNLQAVPLRLGDNVYGAHERESFLYFITEGIVCRYSMLKNGTSEEFAITGREGVIGLAAFLGGGSTSTDALVVSSGYAYRLRVDALKRDLTLREPLQHILLLYTQALITEVGQTAVCIRHHSMVQRLCVWILSCLDRLLSGELAMTQDMIANMLGVRRESVTQAAGKLQKAGLIHCSRGHITVMNRPKLEAEACECYAVVKREYDRLLH